MPLAVRLILTTTAAVIVLGVAAVIVITAGIFGWGALRPPNDQDRDREHVRADPAGAYACDDLDAWLYARRGSFEQALDKAETSRNPAIRDATTEDAMYTACVQAGSNMSPR